MIAEYVFLKACAAWSAKSGVRLLYDQPDGEFEVTVVLRDDYGPFFDTIRPLVHERVEYPGRGRTKRRSETPAEYTERVHKRLNRLVVDLRRRRNDANLHRVQNLDQGTQTQTCVQHELQRRSVGDSLQ